MADSRGLERYQAFLVDWIATAIKPVDPTNLSSYSKEEYELIDTLFRRFTELTETVERLDLCLKFINSPMPRRKGVKGDEYLMYHITFYLQEIYILNERFDAYAKSVVRLRKKLVGKHGPDVAQPDSLLERIRTALSPVVKTRGSHVHARSFTDEQMRELSMYSFFLHHDVGEPEWHDIARGLYRVARTTWVERLTASRMSIGKLLDEYCDYMYELVTAGSPSLLPNNSFKPKPLRGSA
jgi:hypothetical protein